MEAAAALTAMMRDLTAVEMGEEINIPTTEQL